jgi:hypothetical protein
MEAAGPRETGRGKDTEKDPVGDAEGHDPHGTQAGNDEPRVDYPEGETTQPGEETTPDDSTSETEDPGSDEDANTTDPENSGSEASEDTRPEDPEPEPPQETTTAE